MEQRKVRERVKKNERKRIELRRIFNKIVSFSVFFQKFGGQSYKTLLCVIYTFEQQK